MASRVMTKVAQDKVAAAQGAVYYESLELDDPGTSIYIILPFHEIYAMAFIVEGAGTDMMDVTLDKPSMIEDDTANWSVWNGLDIISGAITGFRLRSTAGVGALRACVKTRP